MPSLISILLLVFALLRWGAQWSHAAARRRGRTNLRERAPDPIITKGLRVLPWLVGVFLPAGFVSPLRLYFGWSAWVATAGDSLMIGSGVLTLLTACVLGFRIPVENARSSADKQVT
jgi:hypothetical protein